MKCKVFCIRDKMAEAAMKPLFMENENIAKRSFMDSLTAADSPWSEHPEDYTLFLIGEWDDEIMQLLSHEPVRVMDGVEAIVLSQDRAQKLAALRQEIHNLESEGTH